jgi:GDP-L-fucose synthase
MKILVFGSNGLVGNSLKRKSVSMEGAHKYYFSTRTDTDLFSFSETSKIINDFSPDVLINAAAKVGGINANNTQRVEFLIENLKINLNILESCIPNNNIKIINLGSSCIYPLDAENPINENKFMTGVLEPTNSPYAMAKITSIELANSISTQYGHNVISLMPTNLYGPNDNFSEFDSHVIPGLITRMHLAKINNHPDFNIWGTGSPKREFLHVDDLANAIFHLIDTETNEKLLNIGSGREVTIKDLAKKIQDVVGYEGEVSFDSKMPDGNPRKLLDSNLISSLGWKPSIDLEEGLDSTYKWFLKNLS